jgi:hypothetical protein
MSAAAFTLKVFGLYLLGLGVALVLVPNMLLALFVMQQTNEVWIRVLGLLVFNIGVYYIYAARCEAREFFVASVYTRVLVLAGLTAFVWFGLAKPMLAVFGWIDFLGALWTWRALKKSA